MNRLENVKENVKFSKIFFLSLFRIGGLLLSVFEERISIRKELMEMEGSYRDIAFKIHLKQISIDRIKILITDPAEVEQVVESLTCCLSVTATVPEGYLRI